MQQVHLRYQLKVQHCRSSVNIFCYMGNGSSSWMGMLCSVHMCNIRVANRANGDLKLTWLSVQAWRVSRKYRRHGVTRRSNSGLAKKCLNCPGAVSLTVLETLSFAIAKSKRAGLATAGRRPAVGDLKFVLCQPKAYTSGVCKHRLATLLIIWEPHAELRENHQLSSAAGVS